MAESAIPWRWIGTTGGDRLVIRIGSATVVDVRAGSSTRGGADLNATWRDDDGSTTSAGSSASGTIRRPANVTYLGLYALQHRGQESAASPRRTATTSTSRRRWGGFADVFSRDRPARLPGPRAIGHVRYSTAGSSNLRNAQPITGEDRPADPIAIAHNGNLNERG
jgi:hypothetical protein